MKILCDICNGKGLVFDNDLNYEDDCRKCEGEGEYDPIEYAKERYEEQLEHEQEEAAYEMDRCVCGSYAENSKGQIIKVSDCICGNAL